MSGALEQLDWLETCARCGAKRQEHYVVQLVGGGAAYACPTTQFKRGRVDPNPSAAIEARIGLLRSMEYTPEEAKRLCEVVMSMARRS